MQLSDLIPRRGTAVIISEMQRGIVGDLAPEAMRELSGAVAAARLPTRLAEFCAQARELDVPVIHATLQFRANHVGVRINTPLLAATLGHDASYMAEGSPAAEIIAELAPLEPDVVHARRHGMSAFTGTDLDAILRSLDIESLVIGGVSVNEAIIGMAIEAVNLGYRVAVLSDGVSGLPAEFVDAMLRHSLRLLGPTPTTGDVMTAWHNC
ncbi:cysteine hydrolase [Mycobacterium paraintracellulare]|uniref:cysteine hydrolase n=1 Tax=Mycobacterium paraintracellulare TaxID=1138383 RepID=UPI003891870C